MGATDVTGEAQSALTDDDVEGLESGVRSSPLARIVLVQAVVVYVWFFSRWAIQDFDGFGGRARLGAYDQGVWLLSRLEAPYSTIAGHNLFAEHASFILVPLAPIYWFASSPKALLVAVTVALGIAALPVFLLARHWLRNERAAALVAVGFLVQPALGHANLGEFRPELFAVPAGLFVAWFVARQSLRGFAVSLVLLLATGEAMALAGFAAGVIVAAVWNRRLGIISALASAAYLAGATFGVIRPLGGDLHLDEARLDVLIAPALALAAIGGLALVRRERARLVTAAACAFIAIDAAWLWGPATVASNPVELADPDSRAATKFAYASAFVPDDGVIAADQAVIDHFAHRRRAYLFPSPWSPGDPDGEAAVTHLLLPKPLPATDPAQAVLVGDVLPAFDLSYDFEDGQLYTRRR